MTDPSSSSSSSPRERLLYVPLAELTPGPNAPKTIQAPTELVDSLRTYGVLQPLLARPGEDGYEVIAGFKRLAAAREAGLNEVPIRVYRAEDASLKGLFTASNIFNKGRTRVSPPPASGDFSSAGSLGGLLDEELNHKPGEAPYRFILIAATVILLLIWGGVHLASSWGSGGSGNDEPGPRPTPTPGSGSVLFNDPPPTPVADSSAVERARDLFRDVDGIEVRNAAGYPRIVFQDAVFSSLLTISSSQKDRLKDVVERIHASDPSATLSIIGHTDNDPVRPNGTYRDNDHLGQLRADAVKAYLVETTEVPESQLLSNSSGSTDSPFPNDTRDNKARNRTVTFEVVFRAL